MLSYLLSFVYVGIYWNNHHHIFQLTKLVTGAVLLANLGLLFCLSLFPYTTQWMDSSDYARTPVIVYGVNLLMAAIAYYVLQLVVIRSEGKDSALRKAVGHDFKGRASIVGYLADCVAALADCVVALAGGGDSIAARPGSWVALGCYVAVACLWVIPDPRIDRAVRDHGAAD